MSAQIYTSVVLDTLSEGLIGLDSEQHIVYINRAALYMLGWSESDLLGKKIHEALQYQQRDGSPYPEAESALDWLRSGGALYYIEDIFWRKDGKALEVEISAAVLPQLTPQNGRDMHAFVVFRDLSERKESQLALLDAFKDMANLHLSLEKAHNQLLQSEKLASVGQLAAGIAHEINNPIGFVSSNLGALDKYIQSLLLLIDHYEGLERDGGVQSERLAAIEALKESIEFSFLRSDLPSLLNESRQGVERVSKIVKSLKEFSREGSEQKWLEANLNDSLDSVLQILTHELEGKCTIHRSYGDIVPIQCIPSEINQVFMSILLNAGQAIARRGDIYIRTHATNGHVIVEIRDTGCGISPEVLPRIFDPFFTTKPIGQGTGLGLSSAYGTVLRHGGDLHIDSRLDSGTSVRIALPVKASGAVA